MARKWVRIGFAKSPAWPMYVFTLGSFFSMANYMPQLVRVVKRHVNSTSGNLRLDNGRGNRSGHSMAKMQTELSGQQSNYAISGILGLSPLQISSIRGPTPPQPGLAQFTLIKREGGII